MVATKLSPEAMNELHKRLPGDCLVIGVAALELTGFNAIPDAMAHDIGALLHRPVWEGVIQANRVAHTKASGWHRLVTPALFEGLVEPGRDYLLVDDHVGLGGTLANFRGHIESQGGAGRGHDDALGQPGR
ncbi:MAG TPA: phosphoribosyltransferase, partial [Phenylobacterium sp.]|nr:phosphoribosyltransferase [Phenylobacterium sp.]